MNEIPDSKIPQSPDKGQETGDLGQQSVNPLQEQAGRSLSNPQDNLFLLPVANELLLPQLELLGSPVVRSGSSTLEAFDPDKSPAELAAAGKLIDISKLIRRRSDVLCDAIDAAKPEITVILADQSELKKETPNFLISLNKDTNQMEVKMLVNPEETGNKHISVAIQRADGRLDPTPEQIEEADRLATYLAERLKKQYPESVTSGVELKDSSGVIADRTAQAANLKLSPDLSGLPQQTRQVVQDLNRFCGSAGGEIPLPATNRYFPWRDESVHESDRLVSLKEVWAALFSPDRDAPYQTIRPEPYGGGYRVGRYGFSGDLLVSFLDSLGDPEDPQYGAHIDALVKAGKLSKGFAAKLKNPKFSHDLKAFRAFAAKLHGGHGEPSKAEMERFLPKDMQENLASLLIERMSAKVGNNPDAIVAGMLSGKAADKLSQQDLETQQARQLRAAGQRLYEMADARQHARDSSHVLKWDHAGHVSIGGDRWLSPAAAAAFKAAAEDAKKDGIILVVNSAGRTHDEQARLYRELHGKSPVALPGQSAHETGDALDVQNYKQAEPYLVAVGFIHGNRDGKPIKNDPWHFTFVG